MRLLTRIWSAALACLMAAACGESPTAPSSIAAPTDPIASVYTEPFPAPLSQTLTGTWFLGERRFMTVTQDGALVTGMPSPAEFDEDGVTVTESGLITGAVDGNRVTLTVIDRITLSGREIETVCTAGHTFNGVLAGNTLSGTMSANSTPLTCGAEVKMPDIELPVSGPTTYTRQ